jgi:hypothetical protein
MLQKVTDNSGHVWLAGHPPDTVPVTVGSVIIFTASAQDPLNRALEYGFYLGGPFQPVVVVCPWGPPTTCAWTVPASAIGSTQFKVTVRVKNGTPRLPNCGSYIADSCDDIFILPLQVSAS